MESFPQKQIFQRDSPTCPISNLLITIAFADNL